MKRAAVALLLVGLSTFFLFPFVWQLLTSLRPESELTRIGWPSHFTLDGYFRIFRVYHVEKNILNSLSVALVTTALCLGLGAPAAFALANLPIRGKNILLASALAVSVFPQISTVAPLFLVFRVLGFRDHLLGLVLPYVTFALPLTLWILTQYFGELPRELYRAARVDGCSPFLAFRKILLPLAGPGILTTGILVFISAWNEFLFALTFTSYDGYQTLPVAIALFSDMYQEPWREIAAASVVATLVPGVLTLFFQRRIVSGLTAGAVKE